MYFIIPEQNKLGNTNRGHRPPVFPLKMLVLLLKNYFFFPFCKQAFQKILATLVTILQSDLRPSF